MRRSLKIVGGENSSAGISAHKLACLGELEKKVLWLSSWMIHNANYMREDRDGLKVGGHQASCASAATLLTALYMDVLNVEDRIAVKPHASPVFHALMYLLGRQDRSTMEQFRGLGGAQSYPSRTKDTRDVDFSTGSVGLGVAETLFASLVQDYTRLNGLMGEDARPGRMVALMGDAELDEGNVFEALLEGWKYDVGNLWWVIDYNRQSLDGVINHMLFQKIQSFFSTVDWHVVTLKYGKKLEAARSGPAGEVLLDWIDTCPNDLYSALTFKGEGAWRERLLGDLTGASGLKTLLDDHDDASLHALMTNLAGHDMESVLEAFHSAPPDGPCCFVAYTIKGYGTPLAGHKDNHAGLMNEAQMTAFKQSMGIPDGGEWDPFAGLDIDAATLRDFIGETAYSGAASRRHHAPKVDVPDLPVPQAEKASTQQAFGQILNDLGRGDSDLAAHMVTTSPDVTVSTNLGGWVNQRGLFNRHERTDVFRQENVASVQRWTRTQSGQHFELGIAENNLFLMLSALGLAEPLFGARILPVGTLYDPFVNRGLDALFYACYQDSRFMVVGTPSGVTLAPEGGAHQSVNTPLVGMSMPGLSYFEPAYADELAAIMTWGFHHMQAQDGGSVYLRLSTRNIAQPDRTLSSPDKDSITSGAYWLVPPTPGAELAIVYAGAVAPEAISAHQKLLEDIPGAGLLAVTSPDRLHEDWLSAKRRRRQGDRQAHGRVESLLEELAPDAVLITVIDGHPTALSWLGAVSSQKVTALGVDQFGQSADLDDVYRAVGIDEASILDAAASACLTRIGG
ncbi:MAG: transketolase [Alphaproteobacteria bacterium]|jgi:pyruvate dehydrogenase E1 component